MLVRQRDLPERKHADLRVQLEIDDVLEEPAEIGAALARAAAAARTCRGPAGGASSRSSCSMLSALRIGHARDAERRGEVLLGRHRRVRRSTRRRARAATAPCRPGSSAARNPTRRDRRAAPRDRARRSRGGRISRATHAVAFTSSRNAGSASAVTPIAVHGNAPRGSTRFFTSRNAGQCRSMSTWYVVMSTMSSNVQPASASTSRRFSKHASNCACGSATIVMSAVRPT